MKFLILTIENSGESLLMELLYSHPEINSDKYSGEIKYYEDIKNDHDLYEFDCIIHLIRKPGEVAKIRSINKSNKNLDKEIREIAKEVSDMQEILIGFNNVIEVYFDSFNSQKLLTFLGCDNPYIKLNIEV